MLDKCQPAVVMVLTAVVVVVVEIATAEVEIGTICDFSSYFKYEHFQKLGGFRLQ